jgi:cell division protein FtsQ
MNDDGKIYAEKRPYVRFTKQRPVNQTAAHDPERKQWLSKSLLGVLLVGILVAGWIKLSNPNTFPIHRVKIEGTYSHVNATALRQTILPFIQKGFLKIDVADLQDRLQQLPWIYSATIQRVWPDSLIITLTEQKALARYNDNALLNQYGELFNVDPNHLPQDLPIFIAPMGQQILVWQTYQKLSTLLTPLSLKITILGLDARQSWRLQLSNGIVLFLGKTDPEQRLQRFVAAYPQVVGNRAEQINYVDLRYAHGISVRTKN